MPDHDFEILGQKFSYPKTGPGALAVIAVVVGIVIVLLVVAHTPTERLQLFIAQIYEHNGKPLPEGNLKHAKLVQFWTPSEETQQFLKDSSGSIVDTEKWQEVTPEKVTAFDQQIAARKDVDGYRRYRVMGHGRTKFKAGWWWIMTVRNDFKTEDFVKDYSQFWKNPNTVYIEELVSDPQYVAGPK